MGKEGCQVEPTEEKASRGPARRPRMSEAFALLATAFLLGIVVQHGLAWFGLSSYRSPRNLAVTTGLVVFAAGVAAGWRRRWFRLLASTAFAVPAIVFLTCLSILGTLILQDQPEHVLQGAYGPALVVIDGLFLDDMFHSLGFATVHGLFASGLAMTLALNRKLNIRRAGVMGAHLGILILLAGVAMGAIWGVKGRLNLHTGQSADRFTVDLPGGESAAYPLGFTLQLDDFQLVHYETRNHLEVYDLSTGEPKRLATGLLAPGDESLASFGVRVEGYWPDHYRETVVEPLGMSGAAGATVEVSSPPGRLAAMLARTGTTGNQEQQWVFDDGDPRGGVLSLERGTLHYFWDETRARRFLETVSSAKPSSPHRIVAGEHTFEVSVGEEYPLPGSPYRVEVVRAFNDFIIDPVAHEPANRSTRPNNPAIEVVVKGADGREAGRAWLFARFPSFRHSGEDSVATNLRYEYSDTSNRPEVVAIIAGESSRIWTSLGESPSSWRSFDVGQELRIDRTPLVIQAMHGSVRRTYRNATRSDTANNPVALIRVGGKAEPILLGHGKPLFLDNGNALVMTPEKGGGAVKDYLSTVSVFQDGDRILTRTIEVNDPLEFAGFHVYQTDYRPDDPTFSGFQIVRDPGLWIVYLGFIVTALGVSCSLLLPSLLERKRVLPGVSQGEKP